MAKQELTFGTEKWTVESPDDITISQPAAGLLKVDIKYDKNSLFTHPATLDTITFTPVVPAVASTNGFKSSVEFDVTNALPVSIGGFDLMIFNNTPPPLNALDTMNPTGHPSNYAHFHNTTGADGTGAPFAPETVTAYLPNFMRNPDGLAPVVSKDDTPPSELRVEGILAPGATVSAKVATMHSVEVKDADNGFGINFYPFGRDVPGAPLTTAPVITGLPPTEDGKSGLIKPFETVTITDKSVLPIETTIITVKDDAGTLSDTIGTLTAPGLQHSAVGTYTLPRALPGDLTTALHDVSFGVTKNSTLTLSVDNDTQGAPPPATASTNVTVPAAPNPNPNPGSPTNPPNPNPNPGSPTNPPDPANPSNPPNPNPNPGSPTNPPDPTNPSNPPNPHPDPGSPTNPSNPTKPGDPTGSNPTNPNPNPGSPTNPPDPNAHFHVSDQTTGQTFDTAGQSYNGPVSGIDWEYINITSDRLNVTALTPNVFIHSGTADDGLNVRNTGGSNILDGYTKSNFLDGGSGSKDGHDTFYVDDRAPLSDIWSTVNNFHSGDDATVWGLTQQDFDINWKDTQGATGYQGLTLHATHPNKPTASLTLTGYSTDDLKNGNLSVSFGTSPDTPGLPGSDYMLIHAS